MRGKANPKNRHFDTETNHRLEHWYHQAKPACTSEFGQADKDLLNLAFEEKVARLREQSEEEGAYDYDEHVQNCILVAQSAWISHRLSQEPKKRFSQINLPDFDGKDLRRAENNALFTELASKVLGISVKENYAFKSESGERLNIDANAIQAGQPTQIALFHSALARSNAKEARTHLRIDQMLSKYGVDFHGLVMLVVTGRVSEDEVRVDEESDQGDEVSWA